MIILVGSIHFTDAILDQTSWDSAMGRLTTYLPRLSRPPVINSSCQHQVCVVLLLRLRRNGRLSGESDTSSLLMCHCQRGPARQIDDESVIGRLTLCVIPLPAPTLGR